LWRKIGNIKVNITRLFKKIQNEEGEKLKINIKLTAGLEDETILKGKNIEVETKPNVKVAILLEELGIPQEKVGVIVVGDKIVDSNFKLQANDNIKLFPTIDGG